jgi:hypothetical protein
MSITNDLTIRARIAENVQQDVIEQARIVVHRKAGGAAPCFARCCAIIAATVVGVGGAVIIALIARAPPTAAPIVAHLALVQR